MNKDIEKMAKEYAELENKFRDKIADLENYGSDCNCEDQTVIQFIHNGNMFDEIENICLNCGGMVENVKF